MERNIEVGPKCEDSEISGAIAWVIVIPRTSLSTGTIFILKKLVKFNVPLEDLIEIYILYIRSIVEQCAIVWHSSITAGEKYDLERTQKVALKIIFGTSYTTYTEALELTGLDTLVARRSKLCLTFARKMCEI